MDVNEALSKDQPSFRTPFLGSKDGLKTEVPQCNKVQQFSHFLCSETEICSLCMGDSSAFMVVPVH